MRQISMLVGISLLAVSCGSNEAQTPKLSAGEQAGETKEPVQVEPAPLKRVMPEDEAQAIFMPIFSDIKARTGEMDAPAWAALIAALEQEIDKHEKNNVDMSAMKAKLNKAREFQKTVADAEAAIKTSEAGIAKLEAERAALQAKLDETSAPVTMKSGGITWEVGSRLTSAFTLQKVKCKRTASGRSKMCDLIFVSPSGVSGAVWYRAYDGDDIETKHTIFKAGSSISAGQKSKEEVILDGDTKRVKLSYR